MIGHTEMFDSIKYVEAQTCGRLPLQDIEAMYVPVSNPELSPEQVAKLKAAGVKAITVDHATNIAKPS